jgi:ADP-ribose pyrophosphatase YjhB (NUDIX family)
MQVKLTSLGLRIYHSLLSPKWSVGSFCVVQNTLNSETSSTSSLSSASSPQILLLKHRLRPKPWGPPGGLIPWPESPVQGLTRELHEELGWRVPETDFALKDVLTSQTTSLMEVVFTYCGAPPQIENFVLQKREIIEARWFTLEEIKAEEGLIERHRDFLLGKTKAT